MNFIMQKGPGAQVQRAVYPIILLHFCRGVVPRRHQRKDRRVPQTMGKPGKGGKRFSNGLQILHCFFLAGFREDQHMGLFEHGGQPSNFGISWDTLFDDMDVDMSLSHQVDAVDGDGFRSQDEMETPSA